MREPVVVEMPPPGVDAREAIQAAVDRAAGLKGPRVKPPTARKQKRRQVRQARRRNRRRKP